MSKREEMMNSSSATPATPAPSAPSPPSAPALAPSASVATESQDKNTSVGSNSYQSSRGTTAALGSTLTECAPSRDSSASLNTSINKAILESPEPPQLPPQQQLQQHQHQQPQEVQQQLYMSKPQQTNDTRSVMPTPTPTAPTGSMIVDYTMMNVNSSNDTDDLEAPTTTTATPQVYVEAEVAQDMDSVVNQAVAAALQERERNIINAVQVETAPEDDEKENTNNENHELGEEEAIKRKRMQRLVSLGVGSFIALVLIVVAFLLTGGLEYFGNNDGSISPQDTVPVADDYGDGDDSGSLPFLSLGRNRPFQLCEGDCFFDQDCDEGLMCMERTPGIQEVPGCFGDGEAFEFINFCVVNTNPKIRETNEFPLGLCEGDCDTDQDCDQEMICLQRDSYERVKHCSGGEDDESRTDYCIPQEPTLNPALELPPTGPTLRPTLPPTPSPTPPPLTNSSYFSSASPPTRSPTPSPTPSPTSSPTRSPTDSVPDGKPTRLLESLRFQAINASLSALLLPYHFTAYSWLLQNDTWVPPEESEDPLGLWRERYAMTTLYFDSNGPFWPNKGEWLSEESVCLWNPGIRCTVEGKVNYLEISDWSHIVGSIPSELKALTMLTHLAFDSHELGGSFPSEIGALSLLTRLDLRSNELTGVIPTEIGMLSKLEGLYLRENNLIGELPTEMGLLTNLEFTFLDANFISGSIPTEIGRLKALREISGFNNRLNGSLPTQLGQLTNMEYLLLYDNDLTGPILSEIGQLTNMQWLSLYDNALVGSIPTEIGKLANLWRLNLSSNRLTGWVPAEFGGLFLEYLNIARNQLTGVFPVMTFDTRDTEPGCFMESNQFDDTTEAPSVCQF